MFNNKRFKNPHLDKAKRSFWNFFLWCLGFYKDRYPMAPPPKGFSYPGEELYDPSKPSLTWINHSSFLIKMGELSFLTDPIFGKRCGPFLAPKRKHPPGIAIEGLPPLDFVLVSHNHYDHLESKSVKALHKRFPELHWIVPKGLKKWFLRKGIQKVIELDWWEKIQFQKQGDTLTITAVPSQHFSGRGILDTNTTNWNGYVVEGEREKKAFYFVGDTGYNREDFVKIGQQWNLDLALIPIGTYLPSAFMRPVHLSPKEAVQIHKEIQAKKSVAMHWKTFRLSEEPMERPPYDLYLAMEKQNLDPKSFLVVEPGKHVNW